MRVSIVEDQDLCCFTPRTTAGWIYCCFPRAVLISVAFFNNIRKSQRWGNAGRWPLDNPYFVLSVYAQTPTKRHYDVCPHTPSTQSCGCHGSKVAGPACPTCSLPKEGAMCQSIRSHSSMFLTFLSACLHQAGLPVRSHVQDMTSLFNSFFISLLLHDRSFTGCFTWPFPCFLLTLVKPTAIFGCMVFQLHLSIVTLFSLSFFCPLFCFFPSHVSLLCLTLEESQQSSISIQNQAPTCLWVPACLCTPVCAWGCDSGRPLSPSLISTSTVPVCWLAAIHTHSSPSFTKRTR